MAGTAPSEGAERTTSRLLAELRRVIDAPEVLAIDPDAGEVAPADPIRAHVSVVLDALVLAPAMRVLVVSPNPADIVEALQARGLTSVESRTDDDLAEDQARTYDLVFLDEPSSAHPPDRMAELLGDHGLTVAVLRNRHGLRAGLSVPIDPGASRPAATSEQVSDVRAVLTACGLDSQAVRYLYVERDGPAVLASASRADRSRFLSPDDHAGGRPARRSSNGNDPRSATHAKHSWPRSRRAAAAQAPTGSSSGQPGEQAGADGRHRSDEVVVVAHPARRPSWRSTRTLVPHEHRARSGADGHYRGAHEWPLVGGSETDSFVVGVGRTVKRRILPGTGPAGCSQRRQPAWCRHGERPRCRVHDQSVSARQFDVLPRYFSVDGLGLWHFTAQEMTFQISDSTRGRRDARPAPPAGRASAALALDPWCPCWRDDAGLLELLLERIGLRLDEAVLSLRLSIESEFYWSGLVLPVTAARSRRGRCGQPKHLASSVQVLPLPEQLKAAIATTTHRNGHRSWPSWRPRGRVRVSASQARVTRCARPPTARSGSSSLEAELTQRQERVETLEAELTQRQERVETLEAELTSGRSVQERLDALEAELQLRR